MTPTEPPTSPELRALIIGYEVGGLMKDITYMTRFPDEAKAHRANMQLSIADAMVQLELLATQMGFDPAAIRDMGWAHLRERYEEFEERGWW